ncbi:MAG: FtsX-like permease family protein, partial [Butyrivibrio sp.]
KRKALETICMNSYAMPICDLNLKEGTPVEDLDLTDENVMYLYLGSAYSDIPVGTIDYGDDYTAIVAGIMEGNQRWIKDTLLDGYYTSGLDYSMDCKYAVISVNNKRINSDTFFLCAKDGYTLNQAIAAAKEEAADSGIELYYEALEKRVEKAEKDSSLLISYITKLLVIIVSSTLLMLITIQLAIIISELKNYGIMYSVGFSGREVSRMLLCKQMITALCAIVPSALCCIFVAMKRFGTDMDTAYMFKTILSHYSFPATIIMSVVIILTVQAITCIVLRKMPLVRMINNKV